MVLMMIAMIVMIAVVMIMTMLIAHCSSTTDVEVKRDLGALKLLHSSLLFTFDHLLIVFSLLVPMGLS